MRLIRSLLVALAATSCATAPRTPVITPEGRAIQTLGEAETLVRAGCFDCLVAALAKYDEARGVPSAAVVATAGASRAAALLALRERELGFADSAYLARAQGLAAALPEVERSMTPLLEIVASIPTQTGGQRGSQATSDAQLALMTPAYRNREAWTERLHARANEDPFTAYLFLAFSCAYNTPTGEAVASWVEHLTMWRDAPLVRFRMATCGSYDAPALERLLAADARFVEADYFIGLRAILAGRLDEAADRLQRAHAWHPQWPAVTQSIANVYLTAEEFEPAVAFYERTLELAADHPDALLGKAKALTYLARSEEAIAAVDQLLALERWYVGDARYWRALNQVQLSRHQGAWEDVELAAALKIDAQVPKLAGIIAYRLQQLETARAKFEESRERNPADCETGFYLGVVLGDLRAWAQTPPVLVEAAACLEASNQDLRRQIETLLVTEDRPERKARQIARRDATIIQQERMLATCWFNSAVAHYNLQQTSEARQFAEKVAADQQFGERAREILSRARQ